MQDLHCRDTDPIGQAKRSDPPEKILGLYLSQAQKSDKENGENWRENTDGVLVFVRITLQPFKSRLYSIRSLGLPIQTGVFSVTVAAFIIVSYQSLQPDNADATVRLLSQISLQLAALSNGTPLATPLIFPDATSFQPTAAAVRINVLWFVSLGMSTACALWATLMQQWARRYVQVADRPYVTAKQARIRAYFAEGVEKYGLATAVDVLPILLHFSVLLFYIGLIDFLFNINHTVGFILLSLVALCVLVYFGLSIMPLYRYNSPYLTPFSSVIWFVFEAAQIIKLWFLGRSTEDQREKLKQGMIRAIEEIGATQPWEMDPKSLHRTLLSLDDDHKLEDFLDGLPDLFHTRTGHSSSDLCTTLEPHIVRVTRGLLITCLKDLLPASARRQRLSACLGVIWCFPETRKRHFKAVRDQWVLEKGADDDPWGPLSTETWEMATKATANSDPLTALHAHCVQALIAVMRRHEQWDCPKSEWSAHLQQQLGTSAVVTERHLDSEANHLQLAVAANLLTNAVRLLPKIETKNDPARCLKAEVREILDSICDGLEALDVPEDLQFLLVNTAEVSAVFREGDLMTGSWTKVFAPGATYDTEASTGEDRAGGKSAHPSKLTARLGNFIHDPRKHHS